MTGTLKQKALNTEKLLNDFLEQRAWFAARVGSGDDEFYVNQISEYVNKQKKFWLGFAKFAYDKGKEETLRVVCEFAQQKQKQAEYDAKKHFELFKIAQEENRELDKAVALTNEAKADGKLEAWKELEKKLKE